MREAILTRVETAEPLLFCGSVFSVASNGLVFVSLKSYTSGKVTKNKQRKKEREERRNQNEIRKKDDIICNVQFLYISYKSK